MTGVVVDEAAEEVLAVEISRNALEWLVRLGNQSPITDDFGNPLELLVKETAAGRATLLVRPSE